MHRTARLPAVAVSVLAFSLLAPMASAADTEALSFVSEAGDPVGRGQEMTLSPLWTSGSAGSVAVGGTGTDGEYSLWLAAPAEAPLLPGVYANAHGGAVAYDPTRPQLQFRHESGRCDATNGRFEIVDYKADPSGYVERLHATFEQRCAGSTATLWGQVDIVRPAREPLTQFDIDIEPVVGMVRASGGGYYAVYGAFVATCNSPTGGTFGGILEQRGPGGSTIRVTASDRFGCTPEGSRQLMDFPAEGLRPGRATLTVDAFVIDPILGEEGPYHPKVESRAVILRAVRPGRGGRGEPTRGR